MHRLQKKVENTFFPIRCYLPSLDVYIRVCFSITFFCFLSLSLLSLLPSPRTLTPIPWGPWDLGHSSVFMGSNYSASLEDVIILVSPWTTGSSFSTMSQCVISTTILYKAQLKKKIKKAQAISFGMLTTLTVTLEWIMSWSMFLYSSPSRAETGKELLRQNENLALPYVV